METDPNVRAHEDIALDLMTAIRRDAETVCAPDRVELVSVTVDVTGAELSGPVTFVPRIDRRTRTVVFTGGAAKSGDAAVMTATAIYRIVPAS